MRLKNLDSYFREKLQGYKPAYQEDMWKRIEEKLPASKVQNGSGSWLIPAAAGLVILFLFPFIMKFNNAVDDRFEMSNARSALKSTDKTNNPAGLSASAAMNKTNALSKTRDRQRIIDLSGIHGQNSKITDQFNQSQKSDKSVFHSTGTGRINKTVSDKKTERISEDIKADQLKTFMSLIATRQEPLVDDDSHEIMISKAGKEVSRYSDHGKNVKNKEWANWQSIFYPFWKNPAYAGSEGLINVTVDDKQEFIPEANSTKIQNNFAVDSRLPFLGLGVGMFHSRDLTPYSLQSTTGIAVSKILLHRGNAVLKAGIAGTVINNSLFYNALSYNDQIDPVFGFIRATKEKDPAEMTSAFGLNAGMWFSNKHIMAGLDVTNLNQPRPHHLAEAEPLPRLWRATAGYRFATGNNLQWLPMVEVRRQNGVNQYNATFTAVYKNNFMATVAYQDIAPATGRGNFYIYGSVIVLKNIRAFAAWGYNMEWQQIGINEQFIHAGIKYQWH
jgi:type IX secretion system PorP/SprF family membrane protein